MNRKIFDPEKHGTVICPGCNTQGYIEHPKHQPCPKCGGVGCIMKEKEESESSDEHLWEVK